MTPAAWFGVLFASLAGSVHCAAMCGGFVAAYASADEPSARTRGASHLFYNGGRLVTYVALGASAGTLGRALDLAGRAAGVAHAAGIVTGLLLLLSGVMGLLPRTGLVRLRRGPGRPLSRRISALLAGFRDRPPAARAALLGLTSTLLPCGWLYAFVALAAASGGAADGALLMSAFWLGSIPILLGVGLSLHLVAKRLWARVPRLRSVLVLGVGVITLLSRLQLPAFAATGRAPAPTPSGALPRLSECPCHQHQREAAPLPAGSDATSRASGR